MNDAVKTPKTIEELNLLADRVVDCIFSVHRTIGPGFAESVYELCLMEEFELRGIKYESQLRLPVVYKGKTLKKSFRLDLLVEDEIILELKCASEIIPLFKAQLLSYMKMAHKRLGYVVNFNTPLMKYGLKRLRLDSGSGYIDIYNQD